VTVDAKEIDLGPLKFSQDPGAVEHLGAAVTIKNDGKGFSMTSPEIRRNLVSGGGLFGTYRLAQWHFHWGEVDPKSKLRVGSEHTINGRQSPAEIHFVFYRDSYKSIGEAIMSGGYESLAVVGVLIEDEDSVKMAPPKRKTDPPVDPAFLLKTMDVHEQIFKSIVGGLPNIVNFGTSTTIDLSSFKLSDLLPVCKIPFWSYEGSLTTPDYNEIVAWRVLEDYLVISNTTLKILAETVQDENAKIVAKNYRAVQNLVGRSIYFHSNNNDKSRKPWAKEQCVTVQKRRKFDCALDYVEAISRSVVEDCPIPACQHDNTYMPQQCHKEECWCAAKDGKQIGTRVHYSKRAQLKCDSFKVRGEVSCHKMRSAAILREGAFKPNCLTDGSFENEQCYTMRIPFNKKKFCWCAMKTGERVPGTLNAGDSPGAKRTNCKQITDKDNLCQKNKIGFQRHPFDCQLYVFCLFDSFRICSCPKRMFFNVWTKSCEHRKSNNKC